MQTDAPTSQVEHPAGPQAQSRLPTEAGTDAYEREATELGPLRQDRTADGTTFERHAGNDGFPTSPEGNRKPGEWYEPITKFWKHYIHLAVPHNECRDHLANERTYLAYLRTSLALSMMGVTIAQLLRIEHSIDPSADFGYYVLGRPLGALFQVVAMAMAIVGAHRFWRQQMSMARGKVWASGWELYVIMVVLFLLTVGVFALLIAVDVDKEL